MARNSSSFVGELGWLFGIALFILIALVTASEDLLGVLVSDEFVVFVGAPLLLGIVSWRFYRALRARRQSAGKG